MAVQTGFSIHPPPAKPGKVTLNADVTSMEKEQIDALTGEATAYASGLKDGFDMGGCDAKAV